MLAFSRAKKIILLVIAYAIIIAVGGIFVYKLSHNPISENLESSLPASIGNLDLENEANDGRNEVSGYSVLFTDGKDRQNGQNGNANVNDASPNTINQTQSAPENQISVALFVENKKYEISVPENSSVYDLMEKLRKQSDFRFSGKNYSGLGFFVEEINGIKNNSRNSQYWIYYINGQEANAGISGMKIKQGDIITWKYEQ